MKLTLLGVTVTVTVAFAAPLLAGQTTADRKPRALVFEHVTVIPMDSERTLADRTVVVEGERIVAVGDPASVAVPAGAQRVDGRGQFLLPGLADLHVHVFDPGDLTVFLASGVTSVRNLMGLPMHLELREACATGERIGPRIVTSGPFTNLPDIATADDAARAVREQAAAGYDCVKIHGGLELDTYRALAKAAAAAHLPLVGHLPRNLAARSVLEAGGMAEVSHAEEFLYTHFDRLETPRDPDSIGELATLVAARGVAVTPTLVAYESIADQVADLDAVLARDDQRLASPLTRLTWSAPLNRYKRNFSADDAPGLRANLEFQQRMVKGFHAAGVRLMTGTDANNPSVVAGPSVQRELALLVASGLSPFEALACATRNAGRFLTGRPAGGTLSVGEAADLLLVGRNPLEGFAQPLDVRGVAVAGRWHSREDLDRALAALLAQYDLEREFVARVSVASFDAARELYASRKAEKPDAFVVREETLAMLVVLYPRVGKPDLAVASAELATREYSNSFRAWNRLGEARELTGDAAGARAAYQRSNELRPGNLLASRYLASHP